MARSGIGGGRRRRSGRPRRGPGIAHRRRGAAVRSAPAAPGPQNFDVQARGLRHNDPHGWLRGSGARPLRACRTRPEGADRRGGCAAPSPSLAKPQGRAGDAAAPGQASSPRRGAPERVQKLQGASARSRRLFFAGPTRPPVARKGCSGSAWQVSGPAGAAPGSEAGCTPSARVFCAGSIPGQGAAASPVFAPRSAAPCAAARSAWVPKRLPRRLAAQRQAAARLANSL